MRTAPAQMIAAIIGLNGTGRQLAALLAVTGLEHLFLIDAGRVRPADQARGGYLAEDTGRPRRHATAEFCHRLNPRLDIRTATQVSPINLRHCAAVFCCSSQTRQTVLRRFATIVPFFADVSCADTSVRILIAQDARALRPSLRPLPRRRARRPDEAALALAAIAAGLAVDLFLQHTRGRSAPARVRFDVAHLSLTTR